MTDEHPGKARCEQHQLPRIERVKERPGRVRGKEEAAAEIDQREERQRLRENESGKKGVRPLCRPLPSEQRGLTPFFDRRLHERYGFCGCLVTVNSLTTWLSTEYSVNGWYISSQLCSDQNTSRFGDGFQRFFGELS